MSKQVIDIESTIRFVEAVEQTAVSELRANESAYVEQFATWEWFDEERVLDNALF